MAPPSHPPRSLGQNMVRVAGIFQGLIALPIMLCMGWSVFEYLKYLFNALFAAAILFILIVQRWGPQAAITKSANVWFEIVKSGAATAIWIWLVAVRSHFPSTFPSLRLPTSLLLHSRVGNYASYNLCLDPRRGSRTQKHNSSSYKPIILTQTHRKPSPVHPKDSHTIIRPGPEDQ
ncbi:hypothetical protein CJF30_00001226 [Rutstroemia sp. NJR-2017a BBW]|nr:hypothetical protein CJF30_00001226 [Rutstroemia sp. NJR-2017a BBW]